MLRRLTSTSSTWATVPLRLAMGIAFIGHGAQKVLGSFNGPGLAKFTQFPAPFPFMRPAWLWMGAAAVAELVGGILVLLGLFTRVGAFLIACVMLVAIFGVLWPAFFAPAGMELAVTFLGMSLALLITGGGQSSADRMIGNKGEIMQTERPSFFLIIKEPPFPASYNREVYVQRTLEEMEPRYAYTEYKSLVRLLVSKLPASPAVLNSLITEHFPDADLDKTMIQPFDDTGGGKGIRVSIYKAGPEKKPWWRFW